MSLTGLALPEHTSPVRVGMVGTGFVARGLARHMLRQLPWLDLTAVASRRPERAASLYRSAGVFRTTTAAHPDDLDASAARGCPVVVPDPLMLACSTVIDVVLDVSGNVAQGAAAAHSAIVHGKHVVVINPELDATLGPLLACQARAAGVVYTAAGGDEASGEVELHNLVTSMGMEALMCGAVGCQQDRHRTPRSQDQAGARRGQSARALTTFLDGTRLACEQAVTANATGLRVAQRGMMGLHVDGRLDDLPEWFDADALRGLGGVVDYVTGATPPAGVYVLAATQDRHQQRYLDLYKLGRGPLYSLYLPYRLGHLQVPSSIARAVLAGAPTVAAAAGPRVEVVAIAKSDLCRGQRLDGPGGYLTYGQCENAPVQRRDHLLPLGVAQDCVLIHDVARDEALTYDDVELPPGRLVDSLRREQERVFPAGGSDGQPHLGQR